MSLLGVLALLAVGTAGGGTVDPLAMAIMRQNSDTMRGLHSYEAVYQINYSEGPGKSRILHEFARVIMAKPKRMRYDFWEKLPSATGWTADKVPPGRPDLTLDCDGKINYYQVGRTYKTADTSDLTTGDLAELLALNLAVWADSSGESPYGLSTSGDFLFARRLGRRVVQGIPCDAVDFKTKDPSFNSIDVTSRDIYFVGVKDHLIHREIDYFVIGSVPMKQDSTASNIHLDRDFSQDIFRYTPPKGVRLEAGTPDQPASQTGQRTPIFASLPAQGGAGIGKQDIVGRGGPAK